MAHLAKAIVATESPITMASAVTVGSYPGEFTLDDEAVLVIGGSGGTSLSVIRGARGTAAASHVAGTELVAWDPTPSGGGGGGVSVDNTVDAPFIATGLIAPGAVQSGDNADLSSRLTFKRLGPFSVSFDDAGLLDDGVVLTALPEGALLLWAKAYFTTLWNSAGSAALHLQLATAAIGQPGDLTTYDAKAADVFMYDRGYVDTGLTVVPLGGLVGADGALVAQMLEGVGATATAGECNVYALIAVVS